jgi:hypothetical protein
VRYIRSTGRYAFRRDEWARLAGTTALPGFPEGDRVCYLVEFPDGVTDFCPVAAAHGYEYEFSNSPDGEQIDKAR